MAEKKPKSNRVTPDKLSDEEIQRRWQELTPMFTKWLVMCVVLAVAAYIMKPMFKSDTRTESFFVVALQVTFAGAVCFGFLTLMALVFGRKRGK